jgi:hypothetical protein
MGKGRLICKLYEYHDDKTVMPVSYCHSPAAGSIDLANASIQGFMVES